MVGAVVPQEVVFGHTEGEAVVEDAFEVLGFVVLVVAVIRAEECGRRQLFGVADDDDILAAHDAAHSLAGGHLGRLVEDDEVELVHVDIEELRNGCRRHQHARTARLEDIGYLREESAQRRALHVGLFGAHQDDAFEVVVARCVRAGQGGDEPAVELLPGEPLVFLGECLELVCRLLEVEPRELAEHIVEVELAPYEVVVDALLEATQDVRRRNLADIEGLQDEVEAALSALFHHLLVSAPVGDEVDVFLDIGDIVDSRADVVAALEVACAENLRESVARACAVVVRRHEEVDVTVSAVLGQLDAALVEEVEVEVGVEFRRGGEQLRHGFRVLAHRGEVGRSHRKERGELVLALHHYAAVGLALFQKFEKQRPVLLLEVLGHTLSDGAAGVARPHRFAELLKGHLVGIGAVFVRIFRGENAVLFLRLAEGIQHALCVRHRLATHEIRLHAVQLEQLADVVECAQLRTRERDRAHVEQRQEIPRVLPQVFELYEVDFEDAFAVAAPLLVIGEAADVTEGRFFYVAALLGAQGELREHFQVVVEGAFGELFVEQAVNVEAVRRVLVCEVVEYRLVEREAEVTLAVHRVELLLQLLEGHGNLRRLFLELEGGGGIGERKGVDDVVEHHILVRLVGVQFQAEVAEAYVLQPAVDDGKRRHLFRDEEHSAPANYVVCDDVGDGLRFARAGRPVQHEALGEAVVYRGILRAVRGYRQEHPVVADVRLVAAAVGEVEGSRGQFQPVVDERADDGVLAEAVGLVFDIVPQQIVGKGKACEEHIAQHIPTLEPHRLALYSGEDGKHRLRRVERDGGQTAHIEVEFLIQKFQQGAVDAQVVGVHFNGVRRRGDALAVYRDGVEEKGREFLLGVLLFLPFEESRREVKRERARLLLYGTLLSEKAQQHAFVLPVFVDGAEATVLVFVEYVVRKRLQEVHPVEAARELV